MKIGVIRRIIKEDLGSDVPEWAGKMLSPLNQFIDTTVSALQRNLTFEDNFACAKIVREFTHDTAQSVNPGSTTRRASGVFPISSQSEIITGFGWAYRQDGNIDVTIRFAGGASTKKECTIVVLF